MLVAILFGVSGATIRLPRFTFGVAQGCVGLLVAHSMTMAVLISLAEQWWLMLGVTVMTVLCSVLVGVGMIRIGGLDGSTAAWGTTPGAAAAMVAMAEEDGADSRIVATMQYVRVVCVVVAGALVSHWLGAHSTGGPTTAPSLAMNPGLLFDLAMNLAIVLFGILAGRYVTAGALLIPLFIGSMLQVSGLLSVGLPLPLMEVAYGVLGAYVGLRFDRPTVTYVARRLPLMIAGSLVLILLCAALAWIVSRLLHVDFLSLYLATSPGGLDAMAIIAIDTQADVGLVLAMQTLRLFGVVIMGAYLARLVIRLTRSTLPVKSDS
jgi:membrane AbrB-like protein